MAGYASRNKPSAGVLQKIHAKALALEDRKGSRIVIVTTDLVGLPRSITDIVGARIMKELSVPRERVLFNSSHTHTGPVIYSDRFTMYGLSESDASRIRSYSQDVIQQLFTVVKNALADLKPARVSFGSGSVDFAINRRQRKPDGTVTIGVNPEGPVDHSVPVLRIDDDKGNPRAVLFGYACHNTTITGEYYRISGDYAGFAQSKIESEMPGVTAMYLQLCAGDQNPNPRRSEKLAEQHGDVLAAEVRRVLGQTKRVQGDVRGVLQWRDLPLQPHERADFEKMLALKDEVRVRFAKSMLALYDARSPMRSQSFPVQALRIGKNTVIVGLGGEPVVQYALRFKADHRGLSLVIAGYSNDVKGYLPTAKMLAEGGYEPVDSAMYYGLAMPYAPEVEEMVQETMKSVLKRVMR